jgi:peptidyl-prolyl cis-trans isomerase C
MNLGRIVLLGPVILLATACGNDGTPPAATGQSEFLGPGEVATVDGARIPESVFRLYALNATQRSADELSAEERERIIEDLVYVRVLANEAQRRGLHTERAMAAELELIRWQAEARAMTIRFREENPPTEAELRALYEENLPRLATTQYKARHILVETEDAAAELIGRLDGGSDFEALALEHASGPTGPDGGDLGWFTAESMVEPFANAVRAMEVGTYSSAPVQTQFGWHVILLEESRDQQAPGLEAVRAELVTAVERQKLEAFLTTLRESANVLVVPN